MYPLLNKSYKGRYPFKIATTSFIYPDMYSVNVERISPFLDEIELLFLESAAIDSQILKSEVKALVHSAKESSVTYNIHLPTDIDLSTPDAIKKNVAIESIKRIFDITHSLSPTSYTLHIPYNNPCADKNAIERWQNDAYKGLQQVLKTGIPSYRLAIENMDYPLQRLQPIILDLDLSVCLDIGHLILNKFSVKESYRRFAGRIRMIHLHGVNNGKDHISLDQMPDRFLQESVNFLGGYQETVSLEVFNFKDLKTSLDTLEAAWKRAGNTRSF